MKNGEPDRHPPEGEKQLPAEVVAAVDSLARVKEDLGRILIDRDTAIHLSILALISRENMILLGPPGTAKSLLSSELCGRITDAEYFQRLLTKFTKESELFVSGQGITEEFRDEPDGRIKITRIRNFHERMLPQAQIAFLDEVFKGNSAILNSLLSLINERIYYSNEGKPIPSGLLSLFGASNERPSLEDGLEALYDRFLIRYYVDYLKGDDFTRMLLLDPRTAAPRATTSLGELATLNAFLAEIQLDPKIVESIYHLRERLAEHPTLNILRPSDRRMKNALKLLKANALMNRRRKVTKADIERVFPYVLWDTSPGVSSNIKVQLLDELVQELRKGSASLEKLFEIEKDCGRFRSELEGIVQKVHKAAGNQEATRAAMNEYSMRATRVTAQLDIHARRIRTELSGQVEEAEERIVKRMSAEVEKLQREIEQKVGEFTEYQLHLGRGK